MENTSLDQGVGANNFDFGGNDKDVLLLAVHVIATGSTGGNSMYGGGATFSMRLRKGILPEWYRSRYHHRYERYKDIAGWHREHSVTSVVVTLVKPKPRFTTDAAFAAFLELAGRILRCRIIGDCPPRNLRDLLASNWGIALSTLSNGFGRNLLK